MGFMQSASCRRLANRGLVESLMAKYSQTEVQYRPAIGGGAVAPAAPTTKKPRTAALWLMAV